MKREGQSFLLTCALRNLYYSLRHKGCPIMAIEFEHRGKKYRADTAKEAADLQYFLERSDVVDGAYRTPKVWSADLAMELLNGVGEAQKKFLALLAGNPSMRSTALVEGIGLESEIALAGVVSGLSKQLRKMSMSPNEVYTVEVLWKGKGKERFFSLLRDLSDTFIEIGFPEAWESKKSK